MAEQLGQVANAVTYLHKRVQVLSAVLAVTGIIAIVAVVVAVWR
jgi:hypothetical protein